MDKGQRSPELRQLRALIAVIDTGGFTDAAAELGISQAAVSRAVAGLEDALGARLLRRTTRQVAPTAAGIRVLDRIRAILSEIDDLPRALEDGATEIRLGFAWSAVGRHTTTLLHRWADAHPDLPLVFVQANTPTGGLADGLADIAVVRWPVVDPRFGSAFIGSEARFAAVAEDHPLARRRSVRLADFRGSTLGIDARTGTTTADLWPPGEGPAELRDTHSLDEWLTMIAAGRIVGITSEATVAQYPRPGVAYRAIRDAEPIPVWFAWWRDDPPPGHTALVALACAVYADRDRP